MKRIYVSGLPVDLDPARAVGKGGEADIYDIGGDRVAKVFKDSSHPDLRGDRAAQSLADARILEHQTKLREFPAGLPASVVTPLALAFADRKETRVVGYAMPYLAGADVLFSYHHDRALRASVRPEELVRVFERLHATVDGLHRARVVIGDFNDLNVMVDAAREPHLLDADSMQYGRYLCRMYTARFVDPTLCERRDPATLAPGEPALALVRPHNPFSDWYAFAAMLMECLLRVGPYGGVYRPADPAKRLPHDARPFGRVTVFDPEVIYPKPARPYGTLPDDLLQHFHRVFEKDDRDAFPIGLLTGMRWTVCSQCKTEHARGVCPTCAHAAPASVIQTVTVRGTVTATRLFPSSGGGGVILHATLQDDKLLWLSHECGAFRRETNARVLDGEPAKGMRYRLSGTRTCVGMENRLIVCSPSERPAVISVDANGRVPTFDTNRSHVYWSALGQLVRDSPMGLDAPEPVGTLLPGQSMIWVGPTFGFGFYRAGELFQPFTFDAEGRHSLNDGFRLPPIRGQLVDAICAFSSERCWLLTTVQSKAALVNRCVVLRMDGAVEAEAETTAGDGSWLGTIRGGSAVTLRRPQGPTHGLFMPTDAGIVLAEAANGHIAQTRQYPDTEPFVDSATRLFSSPSGIYAVTPREIHLLRMK